jgi:hypothetical protein
MNMKTIARAALTLTTLVASSPLMSQGAAAQGETQVAVFRADASGSPPQVKTVLGAVSDHLCRRPWDAAATDAEALAPLEAKARALGANALVDVRFDRHRTDLKSPCWQRVSVTGSAVVLQTGDR